MYRQRVCVETAFLESLDSQARGSKRAECPGHGLILEHGLYERNFLADTHVTLMRLSFRLGFTDGATREFFRMAAGNGSASSR